MDTVRRRITKKSPPATAKPAAKPAAKRKPKATPKTLARREKILNNADLIARINQVGEARRGGLLTRNLINEADRIATHAPTNMAAPSIARSLRRSEERFAKDFRRATRVKPPLDWRATLRTLSTAGQDSDSDY